MSRAPQPVEKLGIAVESPGGAPWNRVDGMWSAV